MKLYEAMFIIPSGRARESFGKVREHVAELVGRGDGEIVNCEKWDDRKLSYPIRRHRRATYVISHFRAPPEGVVRIERACQLSETILRVLITQDEDGIGTEPTGPKSAARARTASRAPASGPKKKEGKAEAGDREPPKDRAAPDADASAAPRAPEAAGAEPSATPEEAPPAGEEAPEKQAKDPGA